MTGLCTTWGDNSGYGAMPSWDVSNVPAFNNAFLNRTTFNGDISLGLRLAVQDCLERLLGGRTFTG
ncbi:hypothetical protein [uncultured Planktomarina sp.]|uniref:hypothetical protein n=1 Tax=uncultured Planktomarina sp. TaxID=1538529 RepID=UPI0032614BBE